MPNTSLPACTQALQLRSGQTQWLRLDRGNTVQVIRGKVRVLRHVWLGEALHKQGSTLSCGEITSVSEGAWIELQAVESSYMLIRPAESAGSAWPRCLQFLRRIFRGEKNHVQSA